MYRATNVKVHCTDATLLQMMGYPLGHRRMTKRGGGRDMPIIYPLQRQKQEPLEKERVRIRVRVQERVQERIKERTKDPKEPKEKEERFIHGSDDTTENGCPRGDQCTQRHPARVRKCLRCGATGHQLSTCRRSRRDAQPKAAAKPSASANPRAKSKSKAKPKTRPRKGANAAWAEGEDLESTVQIEEVDASALSAEGLFTACSVFTSFLPTFHNASSATFASSADSSELALILDSGAAHCPLRKFFH